MVNKKYTLLFSLFLILGILFTACAPKATPETPTEVEKPSEPTKEEAAPEEEELVFGLLMVGPYNDKGWSQAHYDAGLYVEQNVPGARMLYIDKVNVADRPGTTPAQIAEELISKGAKVIIFNSDDMKDSCHEFAAAHPEIVVIHASGDGAWKEGIDYKELPNLSNVMGRMEYGKMTAGCAAALSTKTGKIAYLGPLINDETRRLASSAYLGAKYCWENYAGKNPADLVFEINWIGFWFNIPGVTADPTQVADNFFSQDFDVVISGIDTTEALVEAKKISAEGKEVYAIPYDYKGACAEAEDVCLGVPYFNWGPSYAKILKDVQAGTYAPTWDFVGPYWEDINDPDKSAIGFVKGNALADDKATQLDAFIGELTNGLNLWVGPLNLQDGTPLLAEGEIATDYQVWYLPQLLEGMLGLSSPAE